MYNVLLDENNFYTGSYMVVGKLENGIDVETLPPSENSLCYKLIETTEIIDAEETIVQSWEYSQEKYDELEIARVKTETERQANAEYRKSISNETLVKRIVELEENVVTSYTMYEAILKGVNTV